jgi:hypothetical protein
MFLDGIECFLLHFGNPMEICLHMLSSLFIVKNPMLDLKQGFGSRESDLFLPLQVFRLKSESEQVAQDWVRMLRAECQLVNGDTVGYAGGGGGGGGGGGKDEYGEGYGDEGAGRMSGNLGAFLAVDEEVEAVFDQYKGGYGDRFFFLLATNPPSNHVVGFDQNKGRHSHSAQFMALDRIAVGVRMLRYRIPRTMFLIPLCARAIQYYASRV